ncbi:hypothetical protein R1flu_012565 [Riccia fluitans]|uniref:Uncharacterized protein n=1 Tax=Riccia fluitans TaxID=41844 RepID=A0ABD1ZB78_9MARC
MEIVKFGCPPTSASRLPYFSLLKERKATFSETPVSSVQHQQWNWNERLTSGVSFFCFRATSVPRFRNWPGLNNHESGCFRVIDFSMLSWEEQLGLSSERQE